MQAASQRSPPAGRRPPARARQSPPPAHAADVLPRRAVGASRRQPREAPAGVADALGSHAAAVRSSRQQALARAADLLKLKPVLSSGKASMLQQQAGPGPAVHTAALPVVAHSAASSALRRAGPGQQFLAPLRLEGTLSDWQASNRQKQPQTWVAQGGSLVPPSLPASRDPASAAVQPASSAQTSDRAGPAATAQLAADDGAADSQEQRRAAGHQQQQEQLQQRQQSEPDHGPAMPALWPSTHFTDARSHLQRLAAAALGAT